MVVLLLLGGSIFLMCQFWSAWFGSTHPQAPSKFRSFDPHEGSPAVDSIQWTALDDFQLNRLIDESSP